MTFLGHKIYKETKTLLWRNYLIKKRSEDTKYEFLIPLFFALMLYLLSFSTDVSNTSTIDQSFINPVYVSRLESGSNIGIAPLDNTQWSDDGYQYIDNITDTFSLLNFNFLSFSSNDKLETYYRDNNLHAGIIFYPAKIHDDELTYEYTLRTLGNLSDDTKLLYEKDENNVKNSWLAAYDTEDLNDNSYYISNYIKSGLLALQRTIDLTLLNLHNISKTFTMYGNQVYPIDNNNLPIDYVELGFRSLNSNNFKK